MGRFINADNAEYSSIAAVSLADINLYAYCANNPIVRSDPTGDFFFTLLGGAISGAMSALDALANGEDAGSAFGSGFVAGAIAGAGIDVATTALATGGISIAVGVGIAAFAGGVSGFVGTGMSSNWSATPEEYIGNILYGAVFNSLSFGTGPINGEIAKGTIREVVRDIGNHGVLNLAGNMVSGGLITAFGTLANRFITNASRGGSHASQRGSRQRRSSRNARTKAKHASTGRRPSSGRRGRRR